MINHSVALFVVHYSKLKTRKIKLTESLDNCDMTKHWVTEHDVLKSCFSFNGDYRAFDVNPRLIAMDRSNNSRSLVKSRLFARFEGLLLYVASYLLRRGIGYLTDLPYPKRESKQKLELSLMHIECLSIAHRRNLQWALIIEDDAIIDWTLLKPILGHLDELNSEHPIWFNLSSGAGLMRTRFDPQPDSFGFFRVRPWATRCSSGYLVNQRFISKTIQLIEQYGIPDWTAIDIVYQILMRKMRARVYWQEPPSILQGSETGVYQSNWKK